MRADVDATTNAATQPEAGAAATGRAAVLVSCTNDEKSRPYVEALRLVGVAPESIRVVTPERVRPEEAAALAAIAAGVLLCGGPDLEPHHYGEELRPDANVYTAPRRDAVELALLAGARAAKTPLFGICRGLQMANAFLGGTLWQDIPSMVPGAVTHQVPEPLDALAHPVEVAPGAGELGELLAREPSAVNTRHHQAVKDLAPGLQAVAVAPDGVVEAVAGTDPQWWLWAVQWHPENLVALPAQRELFARFREQADARARELAERRGEPALR